MDEQIMQLGAFTFTRKPRGRVAIDVDIETQILPRELTTQEAVQLARFLIRDEELLRDIDPGVEAEIARALIYGEEQGQ